MKSIGAMVQIKGAQRAWGSGPIVCSHSRSRYIGTKPARTTRFGRSSLIFNASTFKLPACWLLTVPFFGFIASLKWLTAPISRIDEHVSQRFAGPALAGKHPPGVPLTRPIFAAEEYRKHHSTQHHRFWRQISAALFVVSPPVTMPRLFGAKPHC